MPKMNISVPHNLNQEDVRNRLQNLVGSLKQQYGDQLKNVQENWSGDKGDFSFTAMGVNVKGTVSVQSNSVNIEGDLPLTALPFKGTIESTIKDRLKTLLS